MPKVDWRRTARRPDEPAAIKRATIRESAGASGSRRCWPRPLAHSIPWAAMAFAPEDMEAVESPLLLSVAHQFQSGPGRLYGPYSGRYPLVLIHAPLYYRLAGLAGWPLTSAGCDPVTAALAAGRVVSAVGFLMTLVAAFGLARLGSACRGPGWWAALLVAATPVCSGLPFEVRPDMLGIGLQTTGILFVLSAIAVSPIGNARLMAGFGCFALAACIKQHFVVAPVVSAFFVLRPGRGAGSASRRSCDAFRIGLAIVAIDYGVEEWEAEAGCRARSWSLPGRGQGPPGRLVCRRQSPAGHHLEMRGRDSLARGRRAAMVVAGRPGRRRCSLRRGHDLDRTGRRRSRSSRSSSCNGTFRQLRSWLD